VTPAELVSLRVLALRLPSREVLYVSPAELVLLRVLALGLPSRDVLYVTFEEHVALRALALGLPGREILYVTVDEHVFVEGVSPRILSLGCAIRDSEEHVSPGRLPWDSPAGGCYTCLLRSTFRLGQ